MLRMQLRLRKFEDRHPMVDHLSQDLVGVFEMFGQHRVGGGAFGDFLAGGDDLVFEGVDGGFEFGDRGFGEIRFLGEDGALALAAAKRFSASAREVSAAP